MPHIVGADPLRCEISQSSQTGFTRLRQTARFPLYKTNHFAMAQSCLLLRQRHHVHFTFSPALKTALGRLTELCFESSKLVSPPEYHSFIPKNLQKDFSELYSPKTFYYVLLSLVERCVFVPGAAESLILNAVHPSLQLA